MVPSGGVGESMLISPISCDVSAVGNMFSRCQEHAGRAGVTAQSSGVDAKVVTWKSQPLQSAPRQQKVSVATISLVVGVMRIAVIPALHVVSPPRNFAARHIDPEGSRWVYMTGSLSVIGNSNIQDISSSAKGHTTPPRPGNKDTAQTITRRCCRGESPPQQPARPPSRCASHVVDCALMMHFAPEGTSALLALSVSWAMVY
jgi:hypothetical protein